MILFSTLYKQCSRNVPICAILKALLTLRADLCHFSRYHKSADMAAWYNLNVRRRYPG